MASAGRDPIHPPPVVQDGTDIDGGRARVERDVDPHHSYGEPSAACATPVSSCVGHSRPNVSVEGQAVELDDDLVVVVADVVDAGPRRALQPSRGEAMRSSDITE